MVLKISTLFVLVALISCDSGVEKLKRGEKYVPKTGKVLYGLHCESCHGENGALGASGAANLRTSKLSDAASKKVIRYGNMQGMMPYKDILEDKSEADSLVKYIKTLRE